MNVNFTKMHGTGNDFIVIDCITDIRLQAISFEAWGGHAKRLCNRRYGIGADQDVVDNNIAVKDLVAKIKINQ
ncbi:MAG: hypothetical protein HQK97_06800 [Nitrospirae bacterium]|nr:hypothetical protein [Nitrospirota bacterium]